MMPTVEMAGMVDDNFPTRMLTRERDRFVIGRDNDCAIVVRDASLSRQHCYLIVEADGSYKIVDMNSTNGTHVKQGGDWVKIREAAVSTKDLVKLGSYEVQISALLLQLQGKAVRASPSPKEDIFLSYRRHDTEPIAGRLFDRLSQSYGLEHIFFDTEAIPSAVDFRSRVQSALSRSGVVLAVIGPRWLPSSGIYQRLLGRMTHKKEDFVQSEIEMAIHLRVPIVPVLVNGLSCPARPL